MCASNRLFQIGIAAFVALISLAIGTSVAVAQSHFPDDNKEKEAKSKKLQDIMERLERTEPSIQEVQQAAMKFHGMEHSQVESYRDRASVKAVVPKVSVEYDRNTIDTDIQKFDFINYPEQQAGADRISGGTNQFTVSGTWDLPKLMYNPEVLEVVSVEQYREKLLKEVTRMYFLRRRLKVGFLLEPPSGVKQRMALQTRIQELTATLDGLTGGVFRDYEEDGD